MVVLTVLMARRRRGALPVITEPGFVDLTSTDSETDYSNNTCSNDEVSVIRSVKFNLTGLLNLSIIVNEF